MCISPNPLSGQLNQRVNKGRIQGKDQEKGHIIGQSVRDSASYYGHLDKRNPVVLAFERDISLVKTMMRRAVSSTIQDDNSFYAKGMKMLVEISIKYKPRLPSKFYLERILQTADFLFEIKLYEVALWHGYSLPLRQLNSVKITEITSVEQFMNCFFPEGFDADQEVFAMKIRAMQGCAMCIFEFEKRHSFLSQKGLCKLLRVLNFIRIMMQAFQQHEHLCWQIYNGSLHMYSICRYLMTMNCSAQALEYLLWASVSVELSIPLMTAKYLPWLVTLYCAVCHCYYDNQATVQAEEFARRALGKINELMKLEEQSEVPATRETQRAYKEASIKLSAMMFKRAVFESRKRTKPVFRVRPKMTLKEIHIAVPWPRTATERMLMGLFDCGAAYFFGIIEALWDSTRQSVKTTMPDEPELQEVILELLSAGISILSGVANSSEQKCNRHPCMSLSAVTSTSSLIDLAITGENKVPIMSAVRFIKLLFQFKQPEAFFELAREMLQVLSGVEGQSFRRAERELALLCSFNSLLSSQKSRLKDNSVIDDRNRNFSMSDEFCGLVETLHKSVCGFASDVQPDTDLVLDVVLFLWGKVKVVMRKENPEFIHPAEQVEYYKWLWSLSVLCDVAFACDLVSVDCTMTAEMIILMTKLLENAAVNCASAQHQAHEEDVDGMKPSYICLLESSSTELLQKSCEVVERGLNALTKYVATLFPQDGAAITDSAFIQKFSPSTPSTLTLSEEENEVDISKKEKTLKSDMDDAQHTQSTSMFLLATDLHLELDIIHHRASLKLLQLNAVGESELLDRIKKNKVSKALFLCQKALIVHSSLEPNNGNKTKKLLEEATSLIEKAELEEKKLYFSSIRKPVAERKDKVMEEDENPPPPPILLSRTDRSLTFAPAPYNLEAHVCWYQLCGRAAVGINQKVRLGDCSLTGTGHMVPVVSGECVLKVEGLLPNQKYVFAVAAYNSQGKLLGNSLGRATFPLLASMPLPLLSAWAHLSQVAFQTEQYTIAKRACVELWGHYTIPDPGTQSTQDQFATTRLHKQTLGHSSPHLCQLFLTSIFTETEINIQSASLSCDSFSDNGPFIWEQEARLAECERILLALDLALWLNDGIAAVEAVVICYGLLVPLIFHQVACKPVVQVLKKCLLVLEENSNHLKQKWTGNTLESLMHMIACITYYLSKALRVLNENQMASVVMDCGRKLLQEVHEAQMQSVTVEHAAVRGEIKITPNLKALHVKNKTEIAPKEVPTKDHDISHPFTGCEDPTVLYDLISSSSLKDTFQLVMKLRRKPYFTEYASFLLQRTTEEGHPDLVAKWGQTIVEFLSRRDDELGLSTKNIDPSNHIRKRYSGHGMKGNEPLQNKSTPSYDDTRKKLRQKFPHSMLHTMRTNREMQAVENLIAMLSSVVHHHKKQCQLRNMCCEERVWKAHINFSMAQAHIALVYQGLDKLHGGALQQRYSDFNSFCFSLAYSGILVWRNTQQQESDKHEVDKDPPHSGLKDSTAAYKNASKNDVVKADGSTDESADEGEDSSQPAEQQMEAYKRTATLLLDSLNKAALHLRRAMVLAHRGSHWTILQCVCQTMWDYNRRMSYLVKCTVHFDPPPVITTEHLHATMNPLLVMATDLIMDMVNKLRLWNLYDSDLTEEELESSFQFSAPLDDSTRVDLRWVRTLVLHTLEQLHDCNKWERLAHFALLFNSYTRERYTLILTPLLVHAQRRLLERISSYRGPSVPQPHHVKTQQATGKVTCRSYAFCQLLTGWTRNPAPHPHVHKKVAQGNATPRDAIELKGAEMRHSMSHVCVPLDLEDTLCCYRQALEKKPHSLQVFQHCRSLLILFLASTQPCFVTHPNRSCSRSTNLVDFSLNVIPSLDLQLYDLKVEEISTINALYRFPISLDHLPTVIAAYATSIKHLHASSHESLRVLALHEMGNIQFYNGNMRLAYSYWSKAIDCALQSSGIIEKWDNMSCGTGSLHQTLKQAGIWGCLQAAGLAAKISQYILTSDIIQRTKCCLLSAHLFKCVLCCSLAQPHDDLQYASHSIRDDLLPGVDLFSEPYRVRLDTTVTSLNFVCHWLYTTGYHITLLPTLALYLHFVGTVCRDVQRTVEAKILKIRALTELCLFTEAVKEAVQLSQGLGILLPHGQYITKDNLQPMKMFCSNRSLLDNTEALEELLNNDIAPEICALYGSTLCLRFNLARVQLILALTNTVHGPPVSDCEEPCINTSSVNSEHHKEDTLDTEGSCLKTGEYKVLELDKEKGNLNLQKVKFHLLERASSLLCAVSQQLVSQSCSKIENLELEIESSLLKANLYLQQGHAKLSSEMAISCMVLLQSSPVITKRSIPGSCKLVSEHPHLMAGSIKEPKDCSTSNPQKGDCPREVEVSERIGVSLWLRCRLSLVRSLAVHTDTPFPGNNITEEAARVIKEGLDECAQWGDLDIQALLMVECAELEAHRGKTDESIAMLQEAVSLLSGRTCMPPWAIVTLAQATLLFNKQNGEQSFKFLKLTQRLLQKQLCEFGQNVILDDEQMCFSSKYFNNIYLPYFSLLDQINSRIIQNQIQQPTKMSKTE